jgi:hypothetical protein
VETKKPPSKDTEYWKTKLKYPHKTLQILEILSQIQQNGSFEMFLKRTRWEKDVAEEFNWGKEDVGRGKACVGFQRPHTYEARGKGSKACVRFSRSQRVRLEESVLLNSWQLSWFTVFGWTDKKDAWSSWFMG